MKAWLAIAALGLILAISGCTAPPAKDYSAFATCVTNAKITEYGAYWCPNCAKVKLTVGDAAWHNLNYVECDPKCVKDASGALPDFCKGFESHSQQCLDMGVNKYPSWVRNGQVLYAGTDLSKVAELSSCTLPP